MTDPKQTAKEIVDKYMPLCYVPWMGGKDEATQEDCAKEAAILHCQGIIDAMGKILNDSIWDEHSAHSVSAADYWQQILSEIEKL